MLARQLASVNDGGRLFPPVFGFHDVGSWRGAKLTRRAG
jgi:hypothetical protein